MDSKDIRAGIYSLHGLEPLADISHYREWLHWFYSHPGKNVKHIRRDVLAHAHDEDMLGRYSYSDLYIFFAFRLKIADKCKRSGVINDNDPGRTFQRFLPKEYVRRCQRHPDLRPEQLPLVEVGPFSKYARAHVWSFDVLCANLRFH